MASRDLKDAVPELEEKVPLIIADYQAQFSDRNLIVICTLRSTAEQQTLFAKGRTAAPLGVRYWVTKDDGITYPSKHNPIPGQPLSRAVDFGVIQAGRYIGDNTYYETLLDLARKYQLRSGWDFYDSGQPINVLKYNGKFKDPPHVEIKD